MDVHQDEIDKLVQLNGPVTDELERQARPIAERARRLAPVSRRGNHGRRPGHLRSRIVIRTGEDAHGVYVDVASTARAPDGFPYGKVMERRRSYLRAAL